jgi:hypothetical protein
MAECMHAKYSNRQCWRYSDLCAPTITLAVGLNSCVVLQPVADSAMVVINRAALILAIFL